MREYNLYISDMDIFSLEEHIGTRSNTLKKFGNVHREIPVYG